MRGEVIYLYAYDVAYEADLPAIDRLLTGAAKPLRLENPKDTPRDFPAYRPLTVPLGDLVLPGRHGPMRFSALVKVFTVGAISLSVRTKFSGEGLLDLVAFREIRFADNTTLHERVAMMTEQFVQRIMPHLTAANQVLEEPEIYTLFCIDDLDGQRSADDCMQQWLRRNEREVAALLDGESDAARLSAQEVEETLKYRYSYYTEDLAVLDWEAALLVDSTKGYEDMLFVFEVANLQLEELKAYDTKLDAVLDKAYDDVGAVRRPHAFRNRQSVLRELREIRMDLAKVTDELTNTTKFFGDWHLARVYMGCAARFHLSEWADSVTRKLRILDSLYTILQQDSTNRVMMILEAAIVALFIVDLIIIALLGVQ